MQVLSDNDRLLNELYTELINKDFKVTKEAIDDVSSDKRYMGDISTFLELYNNLTTDIINTGIIISAIVAFVKRSFSNFKVWIVTDTLEMSADEYLAMSDNARKAVEENFKVVIKQK